AGEHADQNLAAPDRPAGRCRAGGGCGMEIVYDRCCGLAVHKRTLVACRLVPGPQGTPAKTIRPFGTMPSELLTLADWLREGGCTHVAREATGMFCKPIDPLLEGQFTLLVVNAAHRKAVPGRKPEGKDAEWIADPLRAMASCAPASLLTATA